MQTPIKYMKTCLAFFILVLFVFGCSPNKVVELYNNTGEEITIEGCNGIMTVKSNSKIEISPSTCSERLKVNNSVISWSYKLSLPSFGYMGESKLYYWHQHRWYFFNAKVIARIQINSDHKVIALPEGMNFPAKEDTLQPPYFPWVPQAVEANQAARPDR